MRTIVLLIVVISMSTLKGMAQQYDAEGFLNGKVSEEQLRQDSLFSMYWDMEYDGYQPEDSVVNALGEFAEHLSVKVVLGSWCEDSQREVPRFARLANQIGLSDGDLEYICVDHDKQSPEITSAQMEIQFVPTFIIYLYGQEVGQIVEAPVESLEKDLLQMLK